MKKFKPTQVDRIIQYMRDFGSISTMEAFMDLGITKLTTRISEMRSAGMTIIGKPESAKNRYGEKCRFYRYSLPQDDNICVCCGNIVPEGRQVCPTCEVTSHECV